MALEFIDGFDAYGADGVDVSNHMVTSLYQFAQNCIASNDTAYGRGFSIKFYGDGVSGFRRVLSADSSQVWVGAKIKITPVAFGRPWAGLFTFSYAPLIGGVFTQVGIVVDPEGRLAVVRGDPVSAAVGWPFLSAVGLKSSERAWLPPNEWHYVEASAICHNNTGQVIVRVDGNIVVVYDGNTTNSGGAMPNACNTIYFCNGTNTATGYVGSMQVDDVYCCVKSGGAFSDFPGPVTVYTLFPVSDAGPNQMTQFGGITGHYTTVNDQMDDDLTYVWTHNIDQVEWYGLPTLPDDSMLIGAVSVHGRARKSALGSVGFQLLARWGSGLEISTTQPLTTFYQTRQFLMQNDPLGGGWSKQAVNNLNIGFKTVSA
jgi:hypothetical protein